MPGRFSISIAACATVAALTAAGAASAHHSFAVYFDEAKTVEVTGEVTEFQFRNPHGTIEIVVKGEDGAEDQTWKAETNAPVVLRRRGWGRDSLTAGDVITITGWPARDGSNYMRMQAVRRPDGSLVGAGLFEANDD